MPPEVLDYVNPFQMLRRTCDHRFVTLSAMAKLYGGIDPFTPAAATKAPLPIGPSQEQQPQAPEPVAEKPNDEELSRQRQQHQQVSFGHENSRT